MFLENKYTVWYKAIIQKAKNRLVITEYVEKHHIRPRSMGGSDDPINLVKLTAREHYICHRLLVKMVYSADFYKMQSALYMMAIQSNKHQRIKVSSHQYQKLKALHSASVSKRLTGIKRKPFTELHKKKISLAHKGKKATPDVLLNLAKGRTPQSIAKRVASNTGKKRSAQARLNISAGQKKRDPSTWRSLTDSQKQKISDFQKGRSKSFKGKPSPHIGRKHTVSAIQNMKDGHIGRKTVTCEFCAKTVPNPNYKRWHGINCTSNPHRTVQLIQCQYCLESFDKRAFKRWHGDNCRSK